MESNEPLSLRTASALILTASAFGFLFNYLIIDQRPGLGITAFVTLLVLAFVGIVAFDGKSVRKDTAILLLLALFFAGMIGVRANMLLVALDLAAVGALCLLIAEVHVRRSILDLTVVEYARALIPPIQYVEPLVRSLSTVISAGRARSARNTARVIRGLAVAIPLVIVILALFSAADPTFHAFFESILRLDFFTSDYPARIIAGVIVALFITGAFSYALSGRSTAHEWFGTAKRTIGSVEVMTVLSAVTAVFAAYVAVQASYFFGGADYVSSQGLTYAEYARRGFFELNAVCVLAYLILAVSEYCIERESHGHSYAFRAVSTGLIVLTMAIMASSLYKIVLYESVYGFTTLRLYSHMFVILLALTFLSLAYKILVDIRNTTFAFRTFVSIVLFVACMNILNPDAYIAKKNIERFSETGKVDLEYLLSLSDDALPVLIPAAPRIETGTSTILREGLYERMQEVAKPGPWQSARYADIRALDAFVPRKK